jgi:serine/threonine protein phosphatase PrpC
MRVRLAWGAETHQGLQAVVNTDYYLIARFDRAMHMLGTNMPRGSTPDYHGEAGFGAVLADGVGHARTAELASRSAVSTLIDLVLGTPDWVLRMDDAFRARVSKRMSGRLRWVDDHMAEQRMDMPALNAAGATVTTALIHGRDLLVAHIGRSRAYHVRRGVPHCLTTDHAEGRLLGSGGTGLGVDVTHMPLEDGDRIVLCTDGLPRAVQAGELIEVLGGASAPDLLAGELVNRAIRYGAPDDVTAIVLDYGVAA